MRTTAVPDCSGAAVSVSVTLSRVNLPAYSKRFLDPTEAAAYRDKFQSSWSRRISARREARLVLRALNDALAWLRARDGRPDHTRTLLDYPSGAGRFAPLAAARVGTYIAGDHSPAMLKLTRVALNAAGLGARLGGTITGDARSIELPNERADVALCLRLLHHFPEREDRIQILAELRRVTRGPLVTTFLDATSIKQRRHLMRLAKQERSTRRVLVTPDAWCEEAAAAGWQTVHTHALSSWFSGQRVVLCTPI